ncbi:MAG: acetylglutamate kinase [Oscillospiraceae bacterium]|nr:acetylglutamate kinase [Oscillospiraceae bacterium]
MTEQENLRRAEIISEALPYIQEYKDDIIVIKYGGAAMASEVLKRNVISDIVLLQLVGIKVVLVHGGGPEINEHLKKIGKEPKFVNGLRYTDRETMDVVQMVLCGKIGKELAALIAGRGGQALSLSGLDGGMMMAKQLNAELGFVGELNNIDAQPVLDAIDKGYIPVISTVAGGENGESYNINADIAASRLAIALKAKKLMLLTDVRGLLRDPNDSGSLMPVVPLHEVPLLVKEGVISGGMKPKVDCCVQAVREGVSRTHILDGRMPHAILVELLSDSGVGTMIL